MTSAADATNDPLDYLMSAWTYHMSTCPHASGERNL